MFCCCFHDKVSFDHVQTLSYINIYMDLIKTKCFKLLPAYIFKKKCDVLPARTKRCGVVVLFFAPYLPFGVMVTNGVWCSVKDRHQANVFSDGLMCSVKGRRQADVFSDGQTSG